MIRHPVVAGQFYPASDSQLRAVIKNFIDDKAEKQDVTGLVLPHAGYVYSGPVAGATLSRIKVKDTFIIMGPNHTGRGKPLSIMTQGTWETPLGDVEIDTELAGKILDISSHLKEDSLAHQYEHSIEVQIPFLQYLKPDIRIVPIVMSHAAADVYKKIGREIAKAVKETGKEAVIIASSDMSHYEPHESAKKKDKKAIEAILAMDEDELLDRIKMFNISMCGYAPAISLISAAREMGSHAAELVKYQTSGETSGDYSAVVGYAGIIIKTSKIPPPVALARAAVEAYIREGKILNPPDSLTPEMKEKAGVFVSIHKGDSLRGCIGTFDPERANVAGEIIRNAIMSATSDPRFHAVRPDELKYLSYSVDVLTTPEPVDDKSQLDTKRYGVIVEHGFRRGLLLPDLEGVDDVEHQIDICRQKAGITPDEDINLYRFEVKRYK